MWLRSEVARTDAQGHTWGANQRITVEDAIRCSTAYGARASFEEGIKGTLEPGKLADLVVWDHDLLAIDPAHFLEVKPERTMLGGPLGVRGLRARRRCTHACAWSANGPLGSFVRVKPCERTPRWRGRGPAAPPRRSRGAT